MRKFKILTQQKFPNHRHGWDYVVNALNALHNDTSNVLLETTFDVKTTLSKFEHIDEFPIKQEWVGFSHLTPIKPPENKVFKFYNLKDVFNEDSVKLSLKNCKGLYVLSKYVKNYLISDLKLDLPIDVVYHPTELDVLKFDIKKYNKCIVHCGFFLRKFNSFPKIKIPTNYIKKILYPNNLTQLAIDICKEDVYANCSLNEIDHFNKIENIKCLSNNEYDLLLSNNIIFVDFYDSSANNTIIECIARNNPIIVKKHPAIVEYLGCDYPLFYNTLEEASEKINDKHILMAYEYLVNKDKTFLTKEYFLKSIVESDIYKML